MSDYIEGQLVRLSASFVDAAGNPSDPTSVTFKHRASSIPGAEILTYTYPSDSTSIVRDEAGNYHVDISMSDPGTHQWRWESTGDAQAAAQGYFIVDESIL
jgi:hypothetical protein